jgi:hypothetical protein
MISQQTTMDTIRVKEKKGSTRTAWRRFRRMFGVRMNLDGLNGFQDGWLSVKSGYLSD